MFKPARVHLASAACLLLSVIGCATTSTTVDSLDEPAYRDMAFHNFLVVAVAPDYNNRAQFERQMVSAIKAAGASATAYYTLVGNKPPASAEELDSAISAGNFDAVLLTRVVGQSSEVDKRTGAPDTEVIRKSGNFFDLFRYDYEEVNDPDQIKIETQVVIATELYVAAETRKIWAIQSSTKTSEGAGMLIDAEVANIIRRLKKDKLIGS